MRQKMLRALLSLTILMPCHITMFYTHNHPKRKKPHQMVWLLSERCLNENGLAFNHQAVFNGFDALNGGHHFLCFGFGCVIIHKAA